MQIPEKVGSGVEEKDAECAESMPASCNNSEAPKTATNQQIYLNVPNANYLDIQMQHLCIQVNSIWRFFSFLQSHKSQAA